MRSFEVTRFEPPRAVTPEDQVRRTVSSRRQTSDGHAIFDLPREYSQDAEDAA